MKELKQYIHVFSLRCFVEADTIHFDNIKARDIIEAVSEQYHNLRDHFDYQHITPERFLHQNRRSLPTDRRGE